MTTIRLEDALLAAAEEQQNRGLHASATWVTTMALGATKSILASPVRVSAVAPEYEPMDVRMRLLQKTATGLLAGQEYTRCFQILREAKVTHPMLQFLAAYAQHMAGEKGKLVSSASQQGDASAQQQQQQQQPMPGTAAAVQNGQVNVIPHGTGPQATRPINSNCDEVLSLVQTALESTPTDAYLLWLQGVVLQAQGAKQEAIASLIAAVESAPYLRCAWEDLAALIAGAAQLQTVQQQLSAIPAFAAGSPLGESFPFMVFMATQRAPYVLNAGEVAETWRPLVEAFPNSHFVHRQQASGLYLRREFDAAIAAFERCIALDKYCLDGMDEYSSALFVKHARLELGMLAEHCFSVDPFCPESNVVAGNYYAHVRRHDRSLIHFRRAVTTDPTFVSAWTLMGHEYLEVKNTNAAVAAYRAAIAVDPRDYRPWYGLGQIYELLQVYHYALHYYWKTATLLPHDPRMWGAVAGCLERQDRRSEAVRCLEQAEACDHMGSNEYPARARKLAEHYRYADQEPKAVMYYEKLLNSERHSPEDVWAALPYLVDQYTRRAGNIMHIPSRSPSFAPAAADSMQRAVGEAKREEARAALATARDYLDRLNAIVMEHQDSSGGLAITEMEPPVTFNDCVDPLAPSIGISPVNNTGNRAIPRTVQQYIRAATQLAPRLDREWNATNGAVNSAIAQGL